MTVEELQAKRETLVSRIADAVKRTAMGDRTIEYAPVNEMQRSLEILDREIAAASASTSSRRCVFIEHRNG